MRLLWILPLLIPLSHQKSDINCLQNNPEVLDGGFFHFHLQEGDMEESAKDIKKAVGLVSKRFKRVHRFLPTSHELMSVIADGLSCQTNPTGNSTPFFVNVDLIHKASNFTHAVFVYKQLLKEVQKVNSAYKSPAIAGIYLDNHLTDNIGTNLEALEIVFGQKENSILPLGQFFEDCGSQFKNSTLLKYLLRLQFITCSVTPKKKSSPELSADDVIKSCNELRDAANSMNLTAEVMCQTAYFSQGTNIHGIVGSVEDFQRFWCKIVSELAGNQSHTRIIMWSAFDHHLARFGKEFSALSQANYHTGWWKFRSFYGPSEVVEKVEDLPGGTEYNKCKDLCDFCNSTEECGVGMVCKTDRLFGSFFSHPRRICQVDGYYNCSFRMVRHESCIPREIKHFRTTANPQRLSKIRNVQGTQEYKECKNECTICTSPDECCPGMSCETDTSFDDILETNLLRICRLKTTNCSTSGTDLSRHVKEEQLSPNSLIIPALGITAVGFVIYVLL